MSYHEDFLFYTEGYLANRPGEPLPAKRLICTDFVPHQLTAQQTTDEIRRLVRLGWSSVDVSEKYQTFGMNYRYEYWGVK